MCKSQNHYHEFLYLAKGFGKDVAWGRRRRRVDSCTVMSLCVIDPVHGKAFQMYRAIDGVINIGIETLEWH